MKGQLGVPPKSVPMVFVVFNLGILGDEITHKYPRDIRRAYNPGFPMMGYVGRGTALPKFTEQQFSLSG